MRRVRHDTGLRDEALKKVLNWRATPAIVEWERAESTDDPIEVSEEEADRIAERFRQEWAVPTGDVTVGRLAARHFAAQAEAVPHLWQKGITR